MDRGQSLNSAFDVKGFCKLVETTNPKPNINRSRDDSIVYAGAATPTTTSPARSRSVPPSRPAGVESDGVSHNRRLGLHRRLHGEDGSIMVRERERKGLYYIV